MQSFSKGFIFIRGKVEPMAHEIWEYFIALLHHRELFIGGGLSLAQETIERIWEWKPPKWLWAWTFLFLGFMVSSFLTWQEEYRKTHPGLHLSLDEYGFSERMEPKQPNLKVGTPAMVIATVSNLGSPSVADDWHLIIKLPDQENIIDPPMLDFDLPNQPPIKIEGDVIPFSRLLYRETLAPISQGDKKQGFLAFWVDNVPQKILSQKGTKLTLTCRDIAGNLISSPTAVMKGVSEAHRHFIRLE